MVADDAPAEERGRFLPLPARSLRAGTVLPADIYVRTARGQYRLHAGRDSPVDREAKEKINRLGTDTVYVSEADTEIFYAYIENNLRILIEGRALVNGDSVAFIYESTNRLMQHLWSTAHTPGALRCVTTAVEATVTKILGNERALWSMLDMARHDYYTYTHGINVSAIMIAACNLIFGLGREELLQVGLGAMLHDIGKRNIPGDILKKPGSLSAEEFHDIMKHPVWGIELAEGKHRIRRHARNIIISHHERYEGGGYPAGVPSKGLDEPCRMAKIVDVYDALTTHRPYGTAIPSPGALRIMHAEMKGHFDGRLLAEFASFMGIERN